MGSSKGRYSGIEGGIVVVEEEARTCRRISEIDADVQGGVGKGANSYGALTAYVCKPLDNRQSRRNFGSGNTLQVGKRKTEGTIQLQILAPTEMNSQLAFIVTQSQTLLMEGQGIVVLYAEGLLKFFLHALEHTARISSQPTYGSGKIADEAEQVPGRQIYPRQSLIVECILL